MPSWFPSRRPVTRPFVPPSLGPCRRVLLSEGPSVHRSACPMALLSSACSSIPRARHPLLLAFSQTTCPFGHPSLGTPAHSPSCTFVFFSSIFRPSRVFRVFVSLFNHIRFCAFCPILPRRPSGRLSPFVRSTFRLALGTVLKLNM